MKPKAKASKKSKNLKGVKKTIDKQKKEKKEVTKPLANVTSLATEQIKREIQAKAKEIGVTVRKSENSFSQFVKTYDGSTLAGSEKKLLKLIIDKKWNVPRRKSRFLKLLVNGCKDDLSMTDEEKLKFYETLKGEYLTKGLPTLLNKAISKPESEQKSNPDKVSKNKKKKMKRKSEEVEKSGDDDGEFQLVQSNKQKKEKGKVSVTEKVEVKPAFKKAQQKKKKSSKASQEGGKEKRMLTMHIRFLGNPRSYASMAG